MISIVIRTKNSERTLRLVLEKLALEKSDELIVVDSGSSDETLPIADAFGAKIIHFTEPFNYGKALNVGFAEARHEWILSLSSHCIPFSEKFLAEYRQSIRLSDERTIAAYGLAALTSHPKAAVNVPPLMDEASWLALNHVPGGNANALYRRSAWQQHPFSETLVTGEDLEWFLWAMQNGYQVLSLPAAAVLYRNQGSLRHSFRKGLNESKVARQLHGYHEMTFLQLSIALASLVKKYLFGDIPFQTLIRQTLHVSGAFAGSKAR